MICPLCHANRRRELMARHMVCRHDWKEPGTVFAELEPHPGFDGRVHHCCSECGDPASDDAFVAIIEGREPEPCDYCGRVLVRIANDD